MEHRSAFFALPPLLFTVALISAACAGDPVGTKPGSTPTNRMPSISPTPLSPGVTPPQSKLLISGQSQRSEVGSYCWPSETGELTVCADTVGIPTAREPLGADRTFLATFELPLPIPPADLQLTAIRVGAEDELDGSVRGLRWWRPKPGEQFTLPKATRPQMEITLDEGLYLFNLVAMWEGIGDVNYGFLVDVRPTPGGDDQILETEVTSIVTLQDNVVLYSGPGEIYDVVGTSFRGLTWPVLGTSADGKWWQLENLAGEEGPNPECWAPADPVVTAPSEPSSEEIKTIPTNVGYGVVLATAGLNLRTGPDVSYGVITVLPPGELVEITGVSLDGEWWRVICPDRSVGDCWTSSNPALVGRTGTSELPLRGLVYQRVDQQRQLWIVGADEKPALLLESVRALISPDGRFAISCCTSREDYDLLTFIDLGSGEKRILTESLGRFAHSPRWWPGNPEQIVFISQRANEARQIIGPGGNLSIAHTDGSGYQVLEETYLSFTQPAPSPDGQTIAHTRGEATSTEEGLLSPWFYRLDNEPMPFDYAKYGLEEIPNLSFGSPSWSPDGNDLAWVVGGDLVGDGEWKVGLAIFNLIDERVMLLNPYEPAGQPKRASSFSAPDWSPDSKWLAWSGFPTDMPPGFWVLRADGSDGFYVPEGGNPVWCPAGRTMAFNKKGMIYVMETDRWLVHPSGLPFGSIVQNWVSTE